MITRTMIVSLLLVGAGCAHRTHTEASYSGTTYSGSDNGYYYEQSSKGAGARTLRSEPVRNEPVYVQDSTTYAVVTPDPAAATTQGAGARALIGQPEYIVQQGVQITTTESFAGGPSDVSATTSTSG